jgi:hypothetical protein
MLLLLLLLKSPTAWIEKWSCCKVNGDKDNEKILYVRMIVVEVYEQNAVACWRMMMWIKWMLRLLLVRMRELGRQLIEDSCPNRQRCWGERLWIHSRCKWKVHDDEDVSSGRWSLLLMLR